MCVQQQRALERVPQEALVSDAGVSHQKMTEKPPLAIACARPIAWARTNSPVRFTGRLHLYVDGERLGQVPILVIAKYRKDDEIMLFHCDEEWNTEGAAGYDSVEEAKQKAERAYEGISAHWKETGYTEEQTESYLDEVFSDDVCTFCAKRPDQADYFYGSGRGRICEECIMQFYDLLQAQKAEEN